MSIPMTVAFVLYPGLTPLDFVGPLQIINQVEIVARYFGGESALRTTTVAARREPLSTDLAFEVVAARTFDEVSDQKCSLFLAGMLPRSLLWPMKNCVTTSAKSTEQPTL